MARSDTDTALNKFDDLLQIFEESCKPASAWRVGMESEKFGMAPYCKPVAFEGERSISAVFVGLIEKFGWQPYREIATGPAIALRRNNAEISLEPGNQFELSGAPLHTIHELADEIAQHRAELAAVSEPLNLAWYSQGFHPFATREEINTNPKVRYDIMRSYLPTLGSMALDMMLRTCTVQANYDFSSADDALRKMRLALKAQPIATAMFANSPVAEGVDRGVVSVRGHVWLDTDNARAGLLPTLWNENATLQDYARWAANVPMFFIKRGDQIIRNTGQPFADFMRDGFEGERATQADWELHLSTVFPEARLKRTIEVRGADAPPLDLYLALPAFWKGLFYDEKSLGAALELMQAWQPDQIQNARRGILKDGLRAQLEGRSVQSWAEALLDLSQQGLQRAAQLDKNGTDERIHLQALATLVSKSQCPADLFRGAMKNEDKLACGSAALELNRFC